MTKTLATNVNNDIPGVAPYDLYLNKEGNIAMAYNQDAILQAATQTARLVLGELVLNTDAGNPYFQAVFNGVPNISLFNSVLRRNFLSVGGGNLVTEVVSLVSTVENNTLTYEATLKTIFGTSTIIGTSIIIGELLNG